MRAIATLPCRLSHHGPSCGFYLLFVAGHSLVHVEVQVLLNDVEQNAVFLLLQMSFEQSQSVSRHADDELVRPVPVQLLCLKLYHKSPKNSFHILSHTVYDKTKEDFTIGGVRSSWATLSCTCNSKNSSGTK